VADDSAAANWRLHSSIENVVWPGVPTAQASSVLSLLFQFEQTQWLPIAPLRERQREQLELLVNHAVATTPYYREQWRGLCRPGEPLSIAAFGELPLLSRSALQAQFDALRSEASPVSHGPAQVLRTSGSTGMPVRVLGTPLTALFWSAMTLRDHLWHRRDLGRVLAIIRRGMTPGQARSWGRATDGLVDTGPCWMNDVDQPVQAQLDWLAGCDPGYLLTYPSLAKELALASMARGQRLSGLSAVRTLGESIDAETRALCHDAWGVPVTDMYSAEEVGYIALQCPAHEHYHAQAETVLVEVLDDHDQPCPPGGVGRVVVTSLHNFASPIIRYDIGDYAEVGEPCPCGRGLPVIRRILGRVRNTLVTANGERYWPAFGLRALQDALPIRQYQFVQKSYDLIEMRLVATKLSPDQEAKLRARILDCLPAGFDLRLAYADDIGRGASGKFEEFVSEVAPTPAAQ
jgi:phenylacetate-CoA ligase